MEHEDSVSNDNDSSSHFVRPSKPLIRRSKLVLVDLAGSERVHKSGINVFFLSDHYEYKALFLWDFAHVSPPYAMQAAKGTCWRKLNPLISLLVL